MLLPFHFPWRAYGLLVGVWLLAALAFLPFAVNVIPWQNTAELMSASALVVGIFLRVAVGRRLHVWPCVLIAAGSRWIFGQWGTYALIGVLLDCLGFALLPPDFLPYDLFCAVELCLIGGMFVVYSWLADRSQSIPFWWFAAAGTWLLVVLFLWQLCLLYLSLLVTARWLDAILLSFWYCLPNLWMLLPWLVDESRLPENGIPVAPGVESP